jgi:hypothetical protein
VNKEGGNLKDEVNVFKKKVKIKLSFVDLYRIISCVLVIMA